MMIRVATIEDADALFALNNLFENDSPIEMIRAELLESAREIIVIAYMGDEAIAFGTGLIIKSICYRERRIEVEALFVKESYRGRGVGKDVLNYLEQSGASRGIRHFHISVFASNHAAYDMYTKLGYQSFGEVLLEKDIE